MNKNFSIQNRKSISPFKYFKSQTTCSLPLTNLPRQNSQKIQIRILSQSKSKITDCKRQIQRTQLLSLPKIGTKPLETEYLSELSNASLSTQKPKISHENSQTIISKKQPNIFYVKQPSFDFGANQSTCKHIRYNNAIQKIKDMQQINENQFQISERTTKSLQENTSSLLKRRGFSNERQIQNFKLELMKSNFKLQKVNNETTSNSIRTSAQKLYKYFNPLATKLQ